MTTLCEKEFHRLLTEGLHAGPLGRGLGLERAPEGVRHAQRGHVQVLGWGASGALTGPCSPVGSAGHRSGEGLALLAHAIAFRISARTAANSRRSVTGWP